MPPERIAPTPETVWRRYDAMEARLSAPLSERMLDLARLAPGMRVLDLATGRGEPAIRAAHRVGPRGTVLGIDLSTSMLAMARERADREGVRNLTLRVGDAASLADLPAADLPPASFDAALLRWGLMYMEAPRRALAGARQALVPGAPLVLAVFVEPERATWFTLPRRLLARYRPPPPLDPAGPDPFRYAEGTRLDDDLAAAGLRVAHREDVEVPLMEAKTAPDLIDWVRAFGLARLLEGLPEATQQAWEADLVREAEALRGPDGLVRLGAVTRLVVAVA